MPARPKRTPGQVASAANAEWERFRGQVQQQLWAWHDAALCDGERETAAEVFRILQTVHCFSEEWAGITERIDAIAHVRSPARAEDAAETTEETEPPTPAVPAEPPVVSRPAKKKRKLIP